MTEKKKKNVTKYLFKKTTYIFSNELLDLFRQGGKVTLHNVHLDMVSVVQIDVGLILHLSLRDGISTFSTISHVCWKQYQIRYAKSNITISEQFLLDYDEWSEGKIKILQKPWDWVCSVSVWL